MIARQSLNRLRTAASEHWDLARERAGPQGLAVAYVGGEGGGNLGDDVMKSAVECLLARERIKIYPYSYPEREARLRYLRMSGPSFFRGGLLSGGTLINKHWLAKARRLVTESIPVAAIGTGVGSPGFDMSEAGSLDGWPEVLSHFCEIGVRGPLSAAKLHKVGVAAHAIGDLALSLTPEIAPVAIREPVLLLNIAPKPGPPGDPEFPSDLSAVSHAISELHASGYKILPVAMHKADVHPIREVLNAAGLDDEPEVPTSAEQFFELAATADCAFAIRLHAAVLGACVGTPTLTLAYRDKIRDFWQSMDAEDLCISSSVLAELPSRIDSLCRGAVGRRTDLWLRARAWKSEQLKSVEAFIGAMLREAK